jgi:hypothetical protein
VSAFEFEGEHYDISIRCGERVLLRAVREASKATLVIADGFRLPGTDCSEH